MPRLDQGICRSSAARGFVGIGAVALMALQQLTGGVVMAQAEHATTMPAAVSIGQFEELVKPTPVPTVAPTPVPTAVPTPAPKPSVFESGIASTYGEGDGFEGNPRKLLSGAR